MPRLRVTEEHRMPVSIPEPTAVCPRCLDVEPGTPRGSPADPHPGPWAEEMCVPCCLASAEQLVKERGPLAKSTSKIANELAPHAVSIRPMQVWPRLHGPDNPDGPLRMAQGPRDFDGLGREKFWDQSAEERAAALTAMVADAGAQLDKLDPKHWKVANENRIFARGWLSELERVRKK